LPCDAEAERRAEAVHTRAAQWQCHLSPTGQQERVIRERELGDAFAQLAEQDLSRQRPA
jgi:hypothetical protein